MKCDRAQLALSVAMDEPTPLPEAVRAHVAGCAACSAFSAGAQRVRVAARVQVAAPVPDLVEPIMGAIGGGAEPIGTRSRRQPPQTVVPRRAVFLRVAAAAVLGLVVGSLLVSGMWWRRPDRAAAGRVQQDVALAAASMDAYRATYEVDEYRWHPDIPHRRFDVQVDFVAPERLRVEVRDRTAYPAGDWPRNDSVLIVDGSSWSLEGPDACASVDVLTCSRTRPDRSSTTVVRGRPPFDPDAPMPTDAILPVSTLADADAVEVVSRQELDGRPAIVLELRARDAGALVAFFQQAGSWRPFFPTDRVVLWLDEETLVPLRYQVRADGGEDRVLWSVRSGLRDERPGDLLLDVRLRAFSRRTAPSDVFRVSGAGIDGGFRDIAVDELGGDGDVSAPIVPVRLHGLEPYRSGRFEAMPRATLLSYADGLRWLRTTERPGGTDAADVPTLAEPITLRGGSVGYYLPAAREGGGRTVIVFDARRRMTLESNVDRATLLDIAASLPLNGIALPDRGTVPDPEVLSERAGFVPLAPTELPQGMRLVSATVERSGDVRAVRQVFARSTSQPGGFGIRVFQVPGVTLPPPTGMSLATIPLRGTVARWSPEHEQLEWVEDGRYLSVTVPGGTLEDAVAIAESMRGAA